MRNTSTLTARRGLFLKISDCTRSAKNTREREMQHILHWVISSYSENGKKSFHSRIKSEDTEMPMALVYFDSAYSQMSTFQ